ncbi:hypothetical protein EC957_005762 [Mortierella hygrophila]|uniref:Transmembrane protein n=1 Tax=Mortierella hygrophila TaxID=979708 RepID=A0A9P6F0J8_9FUNG|nr:hypothetical protein EC957_005762 [Mortierella hygrophila]
MGNTLVGPGVLRDTLEYPSTTEGSIMVGRNPNNGSHHYQQHHQSSSTNTSSVPLGGLQGLLATPPSTIGIRFRRSYFGQFVFLVGLLSLIIVLQDFMLSSSKEGGGNVTPAVVVGSEEDVLSGRKEGLGELSGGYSRVQTVTTAIAQDSLFQQQQQQKKQQPSPLPSPPQEQRGPSLDEKEARLLEVERLLQADEEEAEDMTETEAAVVVTATLAEPDVVTSPTTSENNNDDRIGGMKKTTMQWMKTFASLLIGHGDLDDEDVVVVEQGQRGKQDMVDDEGLVVFTAETKQQGQEAEIVSLPAVAVMDVLGQESLPEYQAFPVNPTANSPQTPQPQPEPIHAKYQWTNSRIQKAFDPAFEALSSSSPPVAPRPQDKGDEMSRLEIVTWQQDQDLTECRGQKDNYEHDVENLRHVIEEQESDLRDLREQVVALKAQAAAFEAELE